MIFLHILWDMKWRNNEKEKQRFLAVKHPALCLTPPLGFSLSFPPSPSPWLSRQAFEHNYRWQYVMPAWAAIVLESRRRPEVPSQNMHSCMWGPSPRLVRHPLTIPGTTCPYNWLHSYYSRTALFSAPSYDFRVETVLCMKSFLQYVLSKNYLVI